MSRRPTGRSRRFPVQRVGAAAPAPVTLSLVDMIAGWEARDGTLDATPEIASIADLSGNGNTLSATGALGSRPPRVADADYGGELVATLNGTAGESFNRGAFTGGAEAQPVTHYWLGELGTLAASQFLFDGDATHRHFLFWNHTSQQLQYFAGSTISSAIPVTVDTPVAICLVINGASSALYVDDFVTAAHTGNPGANQLSMYEVGVRTGLAMNPMTGRWCASYAYAAAHSQAQRVAVGAYWNQDFGQTITVA